VNLLVLAVLAVPFSSLFLNVGTSGLVQELGRNSTLTGRTLLWQAILSLKINPLLGVGYESFWLGSRVEDISKITGLWPNEAHNGYLEILITLGWIGIALLALVIMTGYLNVIKKFRRDLTVGGLSLAFFVAALAYNFTEAAFKMTHPLWIMFLWAITCVPMVARPESPAPPSLDLAAEYRREPQANLTVYAGS